LYAVSIGLLGDWKPGQKYTDVQKQKVDHEAAALAGLYRDISGLSGTRAQRDAGKICAGTQGR